MFRTELLKLRTTLTPWIVGGVALLSMTLTQVMHLALPHVLPALAAMDSPSGSTAGAVPDLAALTDLGSAQAQRGMLDLLGSSGGGSSSGLTALCMLLLGVLAVTTDFRTGGMVTTALAVPDRLRILAGKAGATAVVALVTGAGLALLTAGGVAAAVATTPGASLELSAGEALGVWGRGLAVLVLLAWLGLAVGTLVRGQVAAVVIVASLAVVEPLAQAVSLLLSAGESTVTSWLPLTLGSLASSGQGVAEIFGGSTDLGPGTALVGLLAWAAVLLGVAAVVFRRRDLA